MYSELLRLFSRSPSRAVGATNGPAREIGRFRAGSQESTSCEFETPKSTGAKSSRNTESAENRESAPASVPGPSKRIFRKSPPESSGQHPQWSAPGNRVLIRSLRDPNFTHRNVSRSFVDGPDHGLTARQVIGRIQKNVGVPWRSETVDTFKAGDPDTPVTGIATTMMATYDVLERAAAAHDNLIITHEPTFYGHTDEIDALSKEGDAVFAAKQAFIEKHHLVVWRFHDHWHARQPDGIQTGMVRVLGWGKFEKPGRNDLFVIPETDACRPGE